MLFKSFFHFLGHLQLTAAELVIGMGLAQQSTRRKELVKGRLPAILRDFRVRGRGHGERALIIACNAAFGPWYLAQAEEKFLRANSQQLRAKSLLIHAAILK
jgi:hypothetical protein